MNHGDGATRRPCPRCGQPVLRQLVGRAAALDVTADDQPMPAPTAAAHRTADRLAWCLRTGPWTPPSLRWVHHSSHPADCPHPHVLDHQCTPTRTTLF